MAINTKNSTKVYNALCGKIGSDKIGSYETFVEKMNDENQRKKVYNALSDLDLGTYENFNEKLGFGSGNTSSGVKNPVEMAEKNVQQYGGAAQLENPAAGAAATAAMPVASMPENASEFDNEFESKRQEQQQMTKEEVDAILNESNWKSRNRIAYNPLTGKREFSPIAYSTQEDRGLWTPSKESQDAKADAYPTSYTMEPKNFEEYVEAISDMRYAQDYQTLLENDEDYTLSKGYERRMELMEKIDPATVGINGKGIKFEEELRLRNLYYTMAQEEDEEKSAALETQYKTIANEIFGRGGDQLFARYLKVEALDKQEQQAKDYLEYIDGEMSRAEGVMRRMLGGGEGGNYPQASFGYGAMHASPTADPFAGISEEAKEQQRQKNNLAHAQGMVMDVLERINEKRIEMAEDDAEADAFLLLKPAVYGYHTVSRVKRGAVDVLNDMSTYDFGLSDLGRMMALQAAARKADKDEPLTKEEEMLLNAAALNLASEIESELGGAYEAGGVTGESLPLMLQMMVNPASGFGNATVKSVGRWALKTAVKKQMGKWTTKALIGGSKLLAGSLVDIPAAGFMAATTGMPATLASAKERELGDFKFSYDDNGNIAWGGHEEGQQFGDAVYNAWLDGSIEYYSEMFGKYYEMLTHGALKNAKGSLYKISKNAYKRGYQMLAPSAATRKFFERVQLADFVGEVGEEYVGGYLRAYMVDNPEDDAEYEQKVDEELDKLFSWENFERTSLDMIPMQVCGAVATMSINGMMTGYNWNQGRKRENRLRANAEVSVGAERLAQLTRLMDEHGEDGQMGEAFRSWAEQEQLSEKQKVDAGRYVVQHALNKGEKMGRQIANYGNTTAMVFGAAYDKGHKMENSQDVAMAYDYAQRCMMKLMSDERTRQLVEMVNADPAAAVEWAHRNSVSEDGVEMFSQQDLHDIENYANAYMTYRGALDRVEEEAEEKKNKNKAEVRRTTHSDGMIHPVMLHDGSVVYVTRGNVLTDESGYPDKKRSNKVVTAFDPKDTENKGKPKLITLEQIDLVLEVEDPNAKIAHFDEETDAQKRDAWDALSSGKIDFSNGNSVKVMVGDRMMDGTISMISQDPETGEMTATIDLGEGNSATADLATLQHYADIWRDEQVTAKQQLNGVVPQAPLGGEAATGTTANAAGTEAAPMAEENNTRWQWVDEDGRKHTGYGLAPSYGGQMEIVDDATGMRTVLSDEEYGTVQEIAQAPLAAEAASGTTANASGTEDAGTAGAEAQQMPYTTDAEGNPTLDSDPKVVGKALYEDTTLSREENAGYIAGMQAKAEQAETAEQNWKMPEGLSRNQMVEAKQQHEQRLAESKRAKAFWTEVQQQFEQEAKAEQQAADDAKNQEEARKAAEAEAARKAQLEAEEKAKAEAKRIADIEAKAKRRIPIDKKVPAATFFENLKRRFTEEGQVQWGKMKDAIDKNIGKYVAELRENKLNQAAYDAMMYWENVRKTFASEFKKAKDAEMKDWRKKAGEKQKEEQDNSQRGKVERKRKNMNPSKRAEIVKRAMDDMPTNEYMAVLFEFTKPGGLGLSAEDVQRQLGVKNVWREGFAPQISKNGVGIEHMAEDIVAMYPGMNFDEGTMRDAIIEILGSVGTKKRAAEALEQMMDDSLGAMGDMSRAEAWKQMYGVDYTDADIDMNQEDYDTTPVDTEGIEQLPEELQTEQEAPFSVSELHFAHASITLATMQKVAKAMGVKIVVGHKKGKRYKEGENGFYDHKENTIYLNENSKCDIGWVFGHELLHAMQDRADGSYQMFKYAVRLMLGEREYKRRVAHTIALYNRAGHALGSVAEAEEEVVANFAGTLLRNGKLFDKLFGKLDELEKKSSMKGWAKVKSIIADFVADMREKMSGIFGGESREMSQLDYACSLLFDLMSDAQKGKVADAGLMGERMTGEEHAVSHSIVTDPATIEKLEKSETMTGYRNVVLNEDGTFGSPMASGLQSKGKSQVKTSSFEMGKWEQSEENADLADENGKINLVKPDGKRVDKVDYNPYIHNRPTRVNKQFKQAWERPQLVYIETAIPKTDLDSGYRADKAAKGVGVHAWPTESSKDKLILSRYDKPMRIVPWEEVADDWEKEFKDSGVNFDIVPPALLPILADRGIEILPPHNGMGKACNEAYEEWKKGEDVSTEKGSTEKLKEENKDRISDKIDQNGSPFMIASDGSIDFGRIAKDRNLQEAPIRLALGNEENGFIHIEKRHGEEIRHNGYKDVFSFIDYVLKNYNQIKIGDSYRNNQGSFNQTYYVQLKDKHNNTVFIQLSRDGEYWNINSAGVFSKRYGKNKETIWSASEVQNLGSASNNASHPSTITEGAKGSNGTASKTPIFNRKGSGNGSNEQENRAENAGNSEKSRIKLGNEEFDVAELEQNLQMDVETKLDDMGFDGVTVKRVKLIGSRMTGNEREDSDLDLLVEYEGDASEDALFNALNEDGIDVNGIKVDVNPITEGKSGTIEQFMERNSGYGGESYSITTYHGSAEDFEKFDHSFMGTGEGSHVYGWGTYVSENDGIAKTYADIAIGNKQKSQSPLVYWKGKRVDFSDANPLRMAFDLADDSRTISDARHRAERYAGMAEEQEMKDKWMAALDILNQSKKSDFKRAPKKGNRKLYTVEIPDDVDGNYIDWNASVSERDRKRIADAVIDKLIADKESGYEEKDRKHLMSDLGFEADNIDGGQLYGSVWSAIGSEKEASQLLNSLGYAGMKVPTNNMRKGDHSKHNYVIFNEDDLNIVEKESFSITGDYSEEEDVKNGGNILQFGNNTLSLPEQDAEYIRRQTATMPKGSKPWAKDFPDAVIHTTLAKLKQHEDYAAAKAGDYKAALRVVLSAVNLNKVRQICKTYRNAIVAYPHAIEASGKNKLPRAYAIVLKQFGLKVANIATNSEPHHTGAADESRLLRRARFDGEVEAGRDYILVDDQISSGATLRDMKDYIEANGGHVVFISGLTASYGGTKIAPSEQTIKEFAESGITNEQLQQYGIAEGTDRLTNAEQKRASRLANSGRNRGSAQRRGGIGQTDGGNAGMQGAQSRGREVAEGRGSDLIKYSITDDVESSAFKNWFGDWEKKPENASKVVDAEGKPRVVYHGTQLMELYFKDGHPYTRNTERFYTFRDGKGYFTANKEDAESFTGGRRSGLYACYLNIRNPFVFDCQGRDWDALEGYENRDGYKKVTTDYIVNDIKSNHHEYDGVILKNVGAENNGSIKHTIDDYIPFTANQIKLSEGNNGEYSTENDDIRYSISDAEAELNEKVKLDKLMSSTPIVINGNEIRITGDYKQNKKNAVEYAKTFIGNWYTNKESSLQVQIQKGRRNGGVLEVLQHHYKNESHIKSIAAIPQIIEESTYIATVLNRDIEKNPTIKEYQHYACWLKIGKTDYLVHAIIGIDSNGVRYYDHKEMQVTKEELLALIGEQAVNQNGFSTTPDTKSTTNSRRKFENLLEILQISSEEIEENVENKDSFSISDTFGENFKRRFGDYKKSISEAEAEVNTNPSEAQKKAGNYRMGHVTVDGMNVTIENPKGSVRRGVDGNGKAWETPMNNTYGYIRGTEGVDGDHIDIFLSDNPADGKVYVVDQVNPETGEFDEHKVMYGFGSIDEARAAYLSNYKKDWKGLGSITEVSKEDFAKWVNSSHRKTKAFAEYAMNRKSLLEMINESAQTIEQTVLTDEQWNNDIIGRLFETPVGIVKFGDNQFEKNADRKRLQELSMILATVENPDIILEEEDIIEGAERDSKYIFIKSFLKPGDDNVRYYMSASIKRGEIEIVISSHYLRKSQAARKLKNGKMLWNRFENDSEKSRFGTRRLDSAQSNNSMRKDSNNFDSFNVNDSDNAQNGTNNALNVQNEGRNVQNEGESYSVSDVNTLQTSMYRMDGAMNRDISRYIEEMLDEEVPYDVYGKSRADKDLQPGQRDFVKFTGDKKKTIVGYKRKGQSQPVTALEVMQKQRDLLVPTLETHIGVYESMKKEWATNPYALEMLQNRINHLRGRINQLNYLADPKTTGLYNPYQDKEAIRYSITGLPSVDAAGTVAFRREWSDGSNIFYSNALRAAEAVKQEKATPDQWLKMILNGGGLKAGEDKWIGLSEWIEEKKQEGVKSLSKEEVLDYIASNQIVIEEVHYAKDPRNAEEKRVNNVRLNYTTHGLNFKREVALVVPTIEPYKEYDAIHFGNAGGGRAVVWVRYGDANSTEITEVDGETKKQSEEDARIANEAFEKYEQSLCDKYGIENDGSAENFEKLVLAITPEENAEWIRLSNLEEDAYKKTYNVKRNRVLVIDEIQSKRHQDGRDYGYESKAAKEYDKLEKEMQEKYGDFWWEKPELKKESDRLDALAKKAREDKGTSGPVPGAPFEKNWMEIAFKRMIRYAAENGYSKIAWTTGTQQAMRYDIAKMVNRINVFTDRHPAAGEEAAVKEVMFVSNGDTYRMKVNRSGVVVSNARIGNSVVKGKHLSEVFGKELAEEIMQKNGEHDMIELGGRIIGGEGMKAFYDKMMPSFVQKYVKKWGAKVSEVELDVKEASDRKMWAVEITPEMRKSVLEGQPLFRKLRGENYEHAQAEMEAIAGKVADMEERLGVKVHICNSIDEIRNPQAKAEVEKQEKARKSGQRWGAAKAWMNKETGEVEVFMPYAEGVEDVEKSVMHEVVGHKGLRELLAEDEEAYMGAMMDIYRLLPKGLQEKIMDAARSNNYDIATSVDEYLADKAMDEYTPTWWSRAAAVISNLLRRIGIDIELSDTDVKYMLWRSRKTLENKGNDSVIDMAEEAAMRWQNGIGHIVPEERLTKSPAYRFVGDYAERQAGYDNIRIAKEMKDAGYNASQIKHATGCEIGADGMWRHELSDEYGNAAKQNPYNPYLDSMTGSMTNVTSIKDMLTGKGEALLREYPEIGEVTVIYIDDANANWVGMLHGLNIFVNEAKLHEDMQKLGIEENEANYNRHVEATVAHEVQHIIQWIEGFAQGAEMEIAEKVKQHYFKKLSEQAQVMALSLSENQLEELLNEEADIDYMKTLMEERTEMYGKESKIGSAAGMILDMLNDNSSSELSQLAEKALTGRDWILMTPKEVYLHSMGEVEARNVMKRYGWSMEQVMNSLAISTEDVEKAKQIEVGKPLLQEMYRQLKEETAGKATGTAADASMSHYSITDEFENPEVLARKAMEDEINHLNDEVVKLRRQLARNKDIEEARRAAVQLVRSNISPEAAEMMGVNDIKAVTVYVEQAKTEKALDAALNRIAVVIQSAKLRYERNRLKKLLATRMRVTDKNGVAVGRVTDDKTRKLVEKVRAQFKELLMTDLDEEIGQMARQKNEMTREHQDPTTPVATKLALESMLDDIQNKIRQKMDEREVLRRQNVEDSDEAMSSRMAALEEELQNTPWLMDEEKKNELVTIGMRKKAIEVQRLENAMKARMKHYRELLDGIEQSKRINQDLLRDSEKAALKADIIKRTEKAALELAAYHQDQRILTDLMKGLSDELNALIDEGHSQYMNRKEAQLEKERDIRDTGRNAVRKWREEGLNRPEDEMTKSEKRHAAFQKSWLKKSFDWLMEPLNSFDFVVQVMSVNEVPGNGKLHELLITGKEGAIGAYDKMRDGIREQKETVEAKLQEIFGEKYTLDKMLEESNGQKYIVNTKHMHDTMHHDAGSVKRLEMTKGEMLYAWLTWRQEDGRGKMEAVGWDEEAIVQLEEHLGSKYIAFGEWLTEEYLPKTREERYNPVHLEAFGTSMSKTEHYFPMRILQEDVERKAGIEQPRESENTGTVPGNIIERKSNTHRIDTRQNAIGVLVKYIDDMEKWAAFTPVCANINVLLKDKVFMNALDNNHKGLSETFRKAAQVATMNYRTPEQSRMNDFIAKVQRMWAGSKISWRFFTAMKQLFSYPVFRGYSLDPKFQWELFKNEPFLVNKAYGNYKWAEEHLPGFRDRIDKGTSGLEILEREGFDLGAVMKKFTNWGMLPNQTIDAITVACGARCVYNLEKRNAMKRGMTEEEAEQHAIIMAEMAFNRSQQSSNPIFLSPKQKSKNVVDVATTAFQNSNIGFTRAAMIGALMIRRSKRGSKEWKQGWNMLVANTLTAQVGWTLGGTMFTWGTRAVVSALSGGDDDDDMEIIDSGLAWSMLVSGLIAGVRGTSAGNWADALLNGNDYEILSGMSEMTDMLNGLKTYVDKTMSEDDGEDAGRAQMIAYEIGRRLGKVCTNVVGINQETYANMVLAAWDACEKGRFDMIDFMLIINAPRSSRREVVKALGHDEDNPDEFAERMSVALGIYDEDDTRGSKYFPTTKPMTDRRDDMIYDMYYDMKDQQK